MCSLLSFSSLASVRIPFNWIYIGGGKTFSILSWLIYRSWREPKIQVTAFFCNFSSFTISAPLISAQLRPHIRTDSNSDLCKPNLVFILLVIFILVPQHFFVDYITLCSLLSALFKHDQFKFPNTITPKYFCSVCCFNFVSHMWYVSSFPHKIRFIHLSRAGSILFSATHLSIKLKSSIPLHAFCLHSRFLNRQQGFRAQ